MNLAASSGSYNPTVSRVPGTYTQFGVWTIDALDVYSSERVSNSIFCNITACTAPTSFSVNTTLAEGNVTLNWSGASGGAGNAITSYEIQYSESTDDLTWDEWSVLTNIATAQTSGVAVVAPSSTRGNFRRFRIQTRGAAGADFFSDWMVSDNSVRRNILPIPPQTVTATPEIYTENQVTVSWSDASPGTSTIRQYVIQLCTSTDDQATWSAWVTAATVITPETFGSTTITVSTFPRTFSRFRISVTDDLNGVTDFVFTDVVMRNSPPLAPFVEAPKAGSITYNHYPIFLIQTQPEPDGHPQSIWINGASGEWYNSVDNPDYFTTPGATADSVKTVFFEPSAFHAGCHTITFMCKDDFSTGAEVHHSFTIVDSPFKDIVANETHVKASHILTLRTAANNLRDYYNLPPYAWESEIFPGRTLVRDWPLHIFELRAVIQEVINKINSFDSAAIEQKIEPIEWLPIGTGRPRADVMEQLKELILKL